MLVSWALMAGMAMARALVVSAAPADWTWACRGTGAGGGGGASETATTSGRATRGVWRARWVVAIVAVGPLFVASRVWELWLRLEGACLPSGDLEVLFICKLPPPLSEPSSWLPELWLLLDSSLCEVGVESFSQSLLPLLGSWYNSVYCLGASNWPTLTYSAWGQAVMPRQRF